MQPPEADAGPPATSASPEPPPTGVVVTLIVGAALVALATGATAIGAAAGPELAPTVDGGTVYLRIAPDCDRSFPEFYEDDPCFSNVTARVVAADGTARPIALEKNMWIWSGTLSLATARASIVVDSDQGTWTREVWVVAGNQQELAVRAEQATAPDGVIGRATGTAWLNVLPFSIAALLLGYSIAWTARPSVPAAQRVRGTLEACMALNVVAFLLLLATIPLLVFVPLLGTIIAFMLRRDVLLWVRDSEPVASPSPLARSEEPTAP